jgi:hypothetical protein
MPESTIKPTNLPERLIVTLRAGGPFFAITNVLCVGILAWAYLSVKLESKTLAVTGSARKAILSDLVTWSGTVTSKDADLVKAYDALKVASDKVKEFIVTNRIPENNITMSAITTSRRFHREELFPSLTYRRALDRLVEDYGAREGELEYLRLLKLTAELGGASTLDSLLSEYLNQGSAVAHGEPAQLPVSAGGAQPEDAGEPGGSERVRRSTGGKRGERCQLTHCRAS